MKQKGKYYLWGKQKGVKERQWLIIIMSIWNIDVIKSCDIYIGLMERGDM